MIADIVNLAPRKLRPERESNPRMEVLQTSAFPLRHPADCTILACLREADLEALIHFAGFDDFFDQAVGVTPFVIVPSENLDESAINNTSHVEINNT